MKKRRVLSALLTLALLLGLAVPAVHAARPGEYSFFDCDNSYLEPYVTMNDLNVVLGRSTTIRFYAHIIDPYIKYVRIQVETLYSSDAPVEIVDVPLKQGCGAFSWTWNVPASRYQTETYELHFILMDANGNCFDSSSICANVVPSAVQATGMDFLLGDQKISEKTLTLYTSGDHSMLCVGFQPANSTTDRAVSYTSSDPSVVKVIEAAGYARLEARKEGTATVTATCGKLSASIPVTVKTVDSIKIQQPFKTTFCVGAIFSLSAYAQGYTWVPCSWASSDPDVVALDPEQEERFICKNPGTAVIRANNGGKTDTITITVKAHQIKYDVQRTEPTCTQDGKITGRCKLCDNYVTETIPATGHTFGEDAVRVEPTATRPGSLTGKCTVCGQSDAVSVIPPIFTDTKSGAWYSRHVDKVYALGLMKGVGEDSFAPEASVTRAMAAAVLYRIAGSPEVGIRSSFKDVPLKSYYTSAVIWAQAQGVVTGFPDGTFRPNDSITREQLAAILYRYARTAGCDVSSGAALSGFPDGGEVLPYAVKPLGWAVGAELINGVGTDGKTYLQPSGNATRAQFATIISRYLAAIKPAPAPEGDPVEHVAEE